MSAPTLTLSRYEHDAHYGATDTPEHWDGERHPDCPVCAAALDLERTAPSLPHDAEALLPVAVECDLDEPCARCGGEGWIGGYRGPAEWSEPCPDCTLKPEDY